MPFVRELLCLTKYCIVCRFCIAMTQQQNKMHYYAPNGTKLLKKERKKNPGTALTLNCFLPWPTLHPNPKFYGNPQSSFIDILPAI